MEILPLTIYYPFDLAQDMFTIDYFFPVQNDIESQLATYHIRHTQYEQRTPSHGDLFGICLIFEVEFSIIPNKINIVYIRQDDRRPYYLRFSIDDLQFFFFFRVYLR